MLILAEIAYYVLQIGTIPVGAALHVHCGELWRTLDLSGRTALRISVGAHHSMLVEVLRFRDLQSWQLTGPNEHGASTHAVPIREYSKHLASKSSGCLELSQVYICSVGAGNHEDAVIIDMESRESRLSFLTNWEYQSGDVANSC